MKNLLTVLALVFCCTLFSQNYIRNGDFDDPFQAAYPTKPTGSGVPGNPFISSEYPTYWVRPTNGSPDFISDVNSNTCSYFYNSGGPWVCPSDNWMGCQNAEHGSNYMGFFTTGTDLSGNAFRELLQCEFDPALAPSGLVAGQCYTLDFWVSLADASNKKTPIDINFSGTQHTQYDNTLGYEGTMGLTPTFEIQHFSVTTSGWYHVILPFTATGGEKWMTLGFFGSESDPGITSVTPGSGCTLSHTGGTQAYYYIDNVSLVISGSLTFIPSTGCVFTNSNPVIPAGTYNNKNILLSGSDINISGGSVTFNNCTIECNDGTTLTVPSGKTLIINGTTIKAGCANMWNGIVVQSGGNIQMNPSSPSTTSYIEDAHTAIDINGGSWQILNSVFNKNARDIKLSNNNIGSGYLIEGVTFDHTQLLNDQTQTPSGKGLYGINVSGMVSGSNPVLVGGTNTSDICQFLGGDYGIQSNDANITVQRCFFTGIHNVGIDFQGNNASVFRTLIVNTGTTFIGGTRCIFAQHKTNLTVQSCSLNNATEDAIEWSDNHDGHLLVGDPIDATKGNSFQNNTWEALVAWDNKTNFSGQNSDLANDVTNLYTTIIIANNSVTASPNSGGFLIGEWALGSHVSYHSLDISANTMHNVTKGIQVSNIRGWGGVSGLPTSPLPQQVFGNMLYTTTASTASALGISVKNAPGFAIAQNGVSSDNTGNQLNSGLVLENSRNTNVYGNIVAAGTCIFSGADMLNTNIHCNWMVDYSEGICLNYTYLRTGSTDLHGSSSEEYNNLWNSGIPWNYDIYDWNSQIDHNQWVWNGAASFLAISYNGSIGSGSIISSTTGTDKCLGPLGVAVYAESGTNTHMIFSGDTTAQWTADYNYEIQRLITDSGSSSVASANIKSIIGIENNIGAGNYIDAQTALSSLTPANKVEQNYKDVLTIFARLNYPVQRDATEGEVDSLTIIAEKFVRTDGAAVTLARTFLAYKYNTYFSDEVITDGEVYGTTSISAPCSLEPSPKTELGFMSQGGNDLPIFGTTIEANGNFTFDPHQLKYYSDLYPDTLYRLYAKYGSQYTVVGNNDFNTLADWISVSPLSFDLSGVAVAIDTITDTIYQSIDSAMSATSSKGDIYSVGCTTTGNKDMLLQKRNSSKTLIWSRTYDGPVSGSDSATCLTIGDDDNIYVAGRIYNGKSYDYQVLKYDPDGNILWTSSLSDSLKRDNTPTGISVDPDDNSVSVTGTSNKDADFKYQFVKFWQCLPSTERRANSMEKAEPIQSASIEFYPNPSEGKITIVMKNQSSGVLELFNLQGQLVFTQQISQSGEISLPEKLTPDGLYLLKFTGEGNSEFNKLVIHRN